MKELWLFTVRFPFGHTEQFLENELPVLCERFERVVLVPLYRNGGLRPLPPNAEVAGPTLDPYGRIGPLSALRWYPSYRRLARALRQEAPSRSAFDAQWPELRSRIGQLLYRAQAIERELMPRYDPERVLLYAYWTYDWATVLALLRTRDPRIRFITRAHGFDLFEDRHKDGWIPFRQLQLEHLDRLFCVSQAGLDHLTARHPEHAGRFELSRLGTKDRGLAPWAPSDVLRLVSCAHIFPLKRVDFLAEALRGITRPVEWIHFGDGPERAGLEKALEGLPPHVRATLHGSIPNEELLAWYRRNPVDLFVHTSVSEGGVPVSMQEAASFGIPLLAIDAGGVREIVNDRTGTLLPFDASIDALRAALEAHASSRFATTAGRADVRACWNEGFRADVNFHRFCDRLLGG
ncbi:MAG: glycosyltransferase [Bacteroidetes bacterium]|nr:glycosyltransferase [Bacteroidota bacterium]